MSVVTCRSVSRVYESEVIPVHALRNVDFSLESGDFVGLAGPSGSGKSTLLHVIGGLDRPTSGEVFVEGVDFGKLSESELSDERLAKMGFVFQSYNLIPVLSALENVEFILQLQGVDATSRRKRAEDALGSLGLGDLTERRPGKCQGVNSNAWLLLGPLLPIRYCF